MGATISRSCPSLLPLRNALICVNISVMRPAPVPILCEPLLGVSGIVKVDGPGRCLSLDESAETPWRTGGSARSSDLGRYCMFGEKLTSRSRGIL